jgi:hypothetical protein
MVLFFHILGISILTDELILFRGVETVETTNQLIGTWILYIHTYMHACMHAYIHTYRHTHIHTYKHTYIHTICIYIYIYIFHTETNVDVTYRGGKDALKIPQAPGNVRKF